MLDITLRVTKSPVHLEQINQITVRNLGPVKDEHMYMIYVDGVEYGRVKHRREEGALELAFKVLDAIRRVNNVIKIRGEKQNTGIPLDYADSAE